MVEQTSTILLWKDIHEIADKVCKHYGLSYGKIVPELHPRARRYGETQVCTECKSNLNVDPADCFEKELSIRIHQLNNPRKPLTKKSILSTLAHELAHLREWDHGKSHRAFEKEIIQFIRELGYEGL